MDREKFYATIRSSDLFGGKLSQKQVDGINAKLDAWGSVKSGKNAAQLAYVLGTVYREAGSGMYPVREGFCTTDSCSIKHVTDMYNRKEISHNYSIPDKTTGKSYFGRGDVQITWADNYQRIGKLLGVDLYHKPELALDPGISAQIAIGGMVGGWFTGHKLTEYITDTKQDFINARRIINGTDHASLVAGYATRFLDAINKSL